MFATGEYGNEIQDDLNAMVGYDEKFNNAIVRHSMDLKDEAIFRNRNPVNVTFHDMKKFDLVNPVIIKLATQVKEGKLTDYQLTKKILQQGEIDKLQLRLDKLKYGVKNMMTMIIIIQSEMVVVGVEGERQVRQVHQQVHDKKWMI